MSKSLISVVIPAYRDEKNLPLMYAELKQLMFQNEEFDYEVIFINDWSPDDTWQVIQKISESDERVRWIHLSRNFWHQWALTAWLQYAKWDAIVTMDSDLQDPVEVAIEMIEKWKEWYEVVYARRSDRNDWFLKNKSAILYYKLLSLVSDTKIPRNVWDFRVMDKKVLAAFLTLKEKDRYIRGMFAWLGFKTWYVDFNRPERAQGESWYTLKKLLTLGMDGMLSFSMFPLRIGFIIWVFMMIMMFLFLTYMVIWTIGAWTIYYYELYKWVSVIGFWVLWLQFVFMWILWEYVGRIYNEARERPVYVISDSINIK